MENLNPESTIVPLTRRKLLAKALYKDSPTSFALSNRKIFGKTTVLSRGTSQPLAEKDLNKTLNRKTEEKAQRINGMQGFLIELWKCCKIGAEIDNLMKLEIGSLFFELKIRNECSKMVQFLGELHGFVAKHNYFPDVLTAYLEEIVSLASFEYPLIRNGMSLSEAECVLGISISKFTIKRIKTLRKINLKTDMISVKPLQTTTACSWILLLMLSDIDNTLPAVIPRYEGNKWELFMDYSSNPGKLVQNIRKIPDVIKKNQLATSKKHLETWTKAYQIFASIKKDSDFPELFYLVSEIFEFYKLVKVSNPDNFIKKIDKKFNLSANSTRSITPATVTERTSRIMQHSRSSSRGLSRKSLPESEKRTQYLYESRFNKRMIEQFAEKLMEKMKVDPDYLEEIKLKDLEKYLLFKEEYIEIHQDNWIQESTMEVVNGTLTCDLSTQMSDTKKEAFLAYIKNPGLLKQVVENAKLRIIKDCK